MPPVSLIFRIRVLVQLLELGECLPITVTERERPTCVGEGGIPEGGCSHGWRVASAFMLSSM